MGRENVKEIIFDYHYGMEAEQCAFFRIPKILMSDPLFRTLSLEAKVLYGMMMDRLVLSAKNGWRDGAGRIYENWEETGLYCIGAGTHEPAGLYSYRIHTGVYEGIAVRYQEYQSLLDGITFQCSGDNRKLL